MNIKFMKFDFSQEQKYMKLTENKKRRQKQKNSLLTNQLKSDMQNHSQQLNAMCLKP